MGRQNLGIPFMALFLTKFSSQIFPVSSDCNCPGLSTLIPLAREILIFPLMPDPLDVLAVSVLRLEEQQEIGVLNSV